MKISIKIMGIIAIASIIAPSFTACDLEITSSDGFVYKGSTALTITGYTGRKKDISIPASIGGKPVTAIGEFAFSEKQLTSVVIPGSVTSIGGRAFLYNKLTSIDIPNSVTEIGDYAFYGNLLTSVTIPDSVISIGGQAFTDNQLTSVTLSNSVIEIKWNAFGYNPLTNFSVASDNPAFTIKDFFLMSKDEKQLNVYYGNEKNVTIPDSVTTINDLAFWRRHLTSVIIPNSVTLIGVRAFYENQLTRITIGANVTLQTKNGFDNSTGPWTEFAFENGFDDAYNSGGKPAGTYTRPNIIGTIWIKE